jgi:hypothetical protein
LYARECCANTWYAIGALRLRQGRTSDAHTAFARAVERVATHPMARVGLLATGAEQSSPVASGMLPTRPADRVLSIEAAVVTAAQLVRAGAHADAARLVEEALAVAPPSNAGWLLPIEPLLHVGAHLDVWTRALAHLRNRAA